MGCMRASRYRIPQRYLAYLGAAAVLAPFLTVLVLGLILHQPGESSLVLTAWIEAITSLATLMLHVIVIGSFHPWRAPATRRNTLVMFLVPLLISWLVGTVLLYNGLLMGLLVSGVLLAPYALMSVGLLVVALLRCRTLAADNQGC
jgi:hypothetical protein